MRHLKNVFLPAILFVLRTVAQKKLQNENPIVIGVGGSSGKTSLSQILAIVLAEKYRVKQSAGKNSEIGLPLDILDIEITDNSLLDWLRILLLLPLQFVKKQHRDIYVAEMGIDSPVEPKNMSYLLRFVHPTIGLVTNIGLEHSVYFDEYITSKDEKSREEELLNLTSSQQNLLLSSLPITGHAIINSDDENIAKGSQKIKAGIITISLSKKTADYFVSHLRIDEHAFHMEFFHLGKSYTLVLSTPVPMHFAYQFLFAIAVGNILQISISSAIDSIEQHFSLPPGRCGIFEGIKQTTLIDSTYNNATLTPMLDMLEFLDEIAHKRRKVAVVGDMRELGSMSRMIHEKVAYKIVHHADLVVLIGPLMKNYVAPILEKANVPFASFLTFTQAKQYILDAIKEDDVILIKGSQNTLFLERVVEMLLKDKANVSKLCRRGTFWDKKRAETP